MRANNSFGKCLGTREFNSCVPNPIMSAPTLYIVLRNNSISFSSVDLLFSERTFCIISERLFLSKISINQERSINDNQHDTLIHPAIRLKLSLKYFRCYGLQDFLHFQVQMPAVVFLL